MPDLLAFKQAALAERGGLGPHLDGVRERLLDFYQNYGSRVRNGNGVVDCMMLVSDGCNLPIPEALLDLLYDAENANGEPGQYAGYQRDHILHSLNLFALGASLIIRSQHLCDCLGACCRETIVKRWAMCALFHDIGYSQVQLGVLSEVLRARFESAVLGVRFVLRCAVGLKPPYMGRSEAKMAEHPDLRTVAAPGRE